jgi:16S rRNA processing protein RimM
MTKEELFYFGYVAGKHGLGNAVKVKADVDDLNHYKNIQAIVAEVNKSLVPFPVSEIRIISKSDLIISIAEGFEASAMLGASLYLPLQQLPKLNNKQFYYHEVVGYSVIDEYKGDIGKIATVLEFPHQQIFSIMKNRTEILIPIIDEFIVEVDKKNKTIRVKAPDGLIDLYLNPDNEEE